MSIVMFSIYTKFGAEHVDDLMKKDVTPVH